uniref:Uncharacterized protein n=1 Tax=Arundo donax TaxID=35708 RepID=A0A0A9HCS0_ARUDO
MPSIKKSMTNLFLLVLLSVHHFFTKKRAYPVLKPPTQGGVWGKEFLDSFTLAKFL